MARRVHALLRGRVQNVGFRVFVQETASRLGLSGWVRNTDDGAVELEAEGDDDAVATLLGAVRRGPRGARVDTLETHQQAPGGPAGPFRIR